MCVCVCVCVGMSLSIWVIGGFDVAYMYVSIVIMCVYNCVKIIANMS